MPGFRVHPIRDAGASAAGLMDYIDRSMRTIGVPTPDLPEITRARKIVERERKLLAELNELNAAPAANLADRVLDGKVSLADAALLAAQEAAGKGETATRVYTDAARVGASRAYDELAAIGDRWVTDVFRPLVEPIVAELAQMTDLLGKCSHQGPLQGHKDRSTRDRWVRANDLARDLEAIHSTADGLRARGIIPARVRDVSDEWRWARLDRLARLAADPLSILDNIERGAEPGIYTEAEAAQHKRSLAAQQASGPADAHIANGGMREIA